MKVQAVAEAAQAVAEVVLVAAEAAVNSAKTISKKTIFNQIEETDTPRAWRMNSRFFFLETGFISTEILQIFL